MAKENNLLADYPVIFDQIVDWGDMDSFAHVNNVVYFRYFENVRIEYFRQIGWWEHLNETGIGPIISETQARFRKPVSYPDTLRAAAKVVELGVDRFRMKHVLYSTARCEIVTEGEASIVTFDYRSKLKVPIPTIIRQRIEVLEKLSPSI